MAKDAHKNPETDRLMAQVGARVRRAREMKNIPRRVLSDRSGVSPRYLAQLEAGDGNISIALLSHVAAALDLRIEWLVGEDDPWTSDTLRVAEAFRTASAATRRAVLDTLSPGGAGPRRARRIALIGLRGAGKSTLGARAGAALGLPFVELNREIEAASGMPLAEVMALYGQDGYRAMEAEALGRIIEGHDAAILAVAGGIVAEPDTYATLLTRFHTIWVRTTPEEHMARVRAQGDTRPMAGNPEAMTQLRALLTAREPVYGRADARLDTSGQPVETSLRELLDLIDTHGFLKAEAE
ncbi:helix-turn-helix transcriptional regulator [Ovoidimarina sediminis]|uniref:helix-turn-helix transcriptional regulator n=1 Tax=Ovoidimarina sediminis TaxID=3079856 RepID=UPI00290E10C0|nr:helix-turn-helix transcriptional regulator [Rhodophyticola sp. MJ-SS7]MDU8943138.1 helix-turn-helix transcriptional regulator [Rhodophyticola sp. MJ-SS7]